MINEIRRIFGQSRTNSCLSVESRNKFLIAENGATNQSYIVPSSHTTINSDECLVVENPCGKDVNHISIDACFLTRRYGYSGQKCDFIAFTDEKFCFVELKSNATSVASRSKNLKKARNQLGATIDYFDNNSLNFLNHTLEAYIVLKNRLYPTHQASIQTRRKKFFDEYEVDLFEKSEVEF
ncbi:hypothetical protein [Saprospira grandis]|uniref:hypothetical protein n=1 Tax=Saprospira grandis TaxID=1008 RepID=UPI0022DDD576|nr:hypothetical protein [Saprospira grandis]WBM73459.1 hypothetical protein OP864_10695 [Saprospira grandis]